MLDRCDECGHKTGEHFEDRGVHILRYEIKKLKKDIYWTLSKMYEKRLMEEISRPSILEKHNGSTIKFSRYGVLEKEGE